MTSQALKLASLTPYRDTTKSDTVKESKYNLKAFTNIICYMLVSFMIH